MRHITIHEYGTPEADQKVVMDAIMRDDVWFEITDKWSKHFGCIGKLDLTDYHAKCAELKKFPHTRRMKPFDIFAGHIPLPLVMGKKRVKIIPTEQSFIEGHDGSVKYEYRKNVFPEWETPKDILGSEIVTGAFVAASGGTGMFLAKVEEVFPERMGNDIRLRARLKMVIDRELVGFGDRFFGGSSQPYRFTSPNPTVAIDNLIVIIPDLAQQAMIAKLGKV